MARGPYFTTRANGIVLAAAAMLFTGCAGSAPGAGLARVVQISSDAQTSLHEHHGVLLVDLHSKSGIGAVTLDFTKPARAARFVLHTSGLEQFRLAFDDVVLELAVGQDGSLRQSAVHGRGQERRLESIDPMWMPVRVVRAGGGRDRAGAGLESVEIETPPGFSTAMPARCAVSWIDFFR